MICPAPAITLESYFRETYKPEHLVGCSRDTLIQYEVALRHWNRFSGSTPLEMIGKREIAQFSEWLLPKRSPATVNKTLRHILPILRFAEDADDIAKCPKYRKLKETKSVPLALTLDEFAKVLLAAESEHIDRGGIPAKLWWRSLLLACWETGLRISAILSVTTRDVLFDSLGLYCQADAQKDREAQWFPLSPTTMDAIKKIYDPTRNLLWQKNVTNETISRNFRRILDRSGIYAPVGMGMCFHRIRKSTASYTHAAGGNAQKKLGHSSPTVTARYLDPRVVVSKDESPPMPLPRFC